MKRMHQAFVSVVLILGVTALAFGQLEDYHGDPLFRYQNIHSGNKVRTIFYNYGLVGNVGEISGEWPLGTGNEYVGDVTPLVAIEFVHPSGDTLQSVITCLSPRQSPEYGETGSFWGFEPLPGFAAPPVPGEIGLVAMSNQRNTWPDFWPDKMYTDINDLLWQRDDNDPGWPLSWNGYFGKNVFNADQESYFQMDDNQDMEWRYRFNDEGELVYYYPDVSDTTRGGLGIRIAVRGFQWSHFLAEDALICHYEITNISDYNYDKVAFGMVVGTLAGGRQDSEDDLAFFDPLNDITYSFDSDNQGSPGWTPVNPARGIEVGWCGYAFLESPGNPYDGIDNDNDANPASPTLTEAILTQMLQPHSFDVGDELVLIDYNTYEREVVVMPASGELTYYFRDQERTLTTSMTVYEIDYNGIDDNFNGLIDERLGEERGGKRLDHVGKAYRDYIGGRGLNDHMIDEARDDGIDNDGDWDALSDDVGFDGSPGTGDEGEGDGVPTYGEPNFDRTDINESDQIGLTSFEYFSPPGAIRMNDDNGIWARMLPGNVDVIPGVAEDGDFIYGSGYFPLPSGSTERFSIALFFGEDSVDIFDNKDAVQTIYDNNYNFARPPDKPTVTAVSGDGFVTLYWDDLSEASRDPSNVGNEYDFEGYKVYRATDPGFLENFTITDGLGRTVFHSPIAQFDLDNGNAGFFPLSIRGVSFYLGEDSGLQHVWTDTTVENGQQYYYAVTAYDNGNEVLGFFPAETSKFIFVDEGGNVTTDINTAVVTPGVYGAGYQPPVIGAAQHIAGASSGLVYTEVINPASIEDNRDYRIEFGDVDDNNEATTFSIIDISDPDNQQYVLTDAALGNTYRNRRILDRFDEYFQELYNDTLGVFETWQWFTTVETPVFDGMRAYFLVPQRPGDQIGPLSGWEHEDETHAETILNYSFDIISYPSQYFVGTPFYADYQIEFFDEVVDTSEYFNWYGLLEFPRQPINFRVLNTATNEYPTVVVAEGDTSSGNGYMDHNESILIFETVEGSAGQDSSIATWSFTFTKDTRTGRINSPVSGDKIVVQMYKPFSDLDVFRFDTESARIDEEEVDLSRILVYPNPYLGASTQEPPNPYVSGRGERRITFIHLPNECTIRIYNIRGEMVDYIEHNAPIDDGSATWDLRSQDGLDVAFGVYIYHVDSPYGEHIGRFALIK